MSVELIPVKVDDRDLPRLQVPELGAGRGDCDDLALASADVPGRAWDEVLTRKAARRLGH
jgi:hypothetical protein